MANVAPYTISTTPVYVGTVQPGGSIVIQNTGSVTAFAGTVKPGGASGLTVSNGLSLAAGASITETDAQDAHDWYVVSSGGGTTVAVSQ